MIELDIALAGAAVGFVVGLTGMGGGALMTPMLVLVFGINPLAAVSSDLVAGAVMKPIGGAVHLRKGTVIMPLVRWLVIGSVPSAFLAVVAVRAFSVESSLDDLFETFIGAALLLAAIGLLSKALIGTRSAALNDDELVEVTVHRGRTLAIGIVGGVMVGLTSVGSGSLMMVLLLVTYPMLTARQLVGTDLVQATPLVASAALAHIIFGEVQWWLTASLLLGAVPAVYFGARVSSRAPDQVIRPVLAMVLSGSGLALLGASNVAVATAAVAVGAVYVVLSRRPWARSTDPPATA